MPSSTARPSTWWNAGMCGGVELVGAEDPPDRRDVDRHAALEEGAGLHRRGVGAQDEAALGRVDVEGVLHLPRRVVGVEVEGVEVEPLRLDLRALGDLPAHADEEVGDPLAHQLDGVAPAERAAAGGQRDVDGLLGEDALVALGLELDLPGGEGLGDPAAGLADALAGLGLGARRQRPDLAVGQGEGAPVALVGAAHGLELVEARSRRRRPRGPRRRRRRSRPGRARRPRRGRSWCWVLTWCPLHEGSGAPESRWARAGRVGAGSAPGRGGRRCRRGGSAVSARGGPGPGAR